LLPLRLWIAVAGYSAVITAATLTGFVVAIEIMAMDPKSAVTIAFLTLALSQLWHVFNMRDAGTGLVRNEITRNPYIWAALGLCVGLILAAIHIPYLSGILGLAPPSATGWALSVGLSAIPFLLGQLLKVSAIAYIARKVQPEGR
jgi:Ca2+-transporting ATPase